MPRFFIYALAMFLSAGFFSAHAQTLSVPRGADSAAKNKTHTVQDARSEVTIALNARLTLADSSTAADGKLTLRVVSELAAPRSGEPQQRLVLQIPLASTAEAYGESRSCSIAKDGAMTFTFTAGLDEKNFVVFAAADKDKHFEFLLNKYLCRALAAPFSCDSATGERTKQTLPRDMAHWKAAISTTVELDSKDAPARAKISSVAVMSSGKAFDYATCEKIAPSNGMCCVQHKSTQWHCGGTPVGEGWHQVSGDCFHRETGASCTE